LQEQIDHQKAKQEGTAKVAVNPKGFALWCDTGSHPFSAKDADMEQIVRPAKGPYSEDDVLTMCGEHNIFRPTSAEEDSKAIQGSAEKVPE
jgi:hypothetical protein